jgi:hypothetical protein
MSKKTSQRILRVAGITLLVVFTVIGIRAQQPKLLRQAQSGTTNWLGYVTFGQMNDLDPISHEAYPQVDRQMEIGLRSDGVVVWRMARK